MKHLKSTFVGVLALAALAVCARVVPSPIVRAAEPALPVKPAISDEAATAVSQMGKTLLAKEFSFNAKILQVYLDQSGQPLHISHSMKVIVDRPDRLAVNATGDDGALELRFNGKSAAVFWPDGKQYAEIATTGNVFPSALDEVLEKLNIDFPLLDFFSEALDKSFLSGVTAGWQVGIAMIDGVECRHLFFTQRGGIDLELWVEKNDAAIPHRLIVAYRLLPGHPDFIAEFTNWDATVHPADSEFTFQPPTGATKIELGEAAAPGETRSN